MPANLRLGPPTVRLRAISAGGSPAFSDHEACAVEPVGELIFFNR